MARRQGLDDPEVASPWGFSIESVLNTPSAAGDATSSGTICPAARAGSGKRGGLRIIYYWFPPEQAFYMLYAYAKNEQGDLTAAQAKMLGRLVREEFK